MRRNVLSLSGIALALLALSAMPAKGADIAGAERQPLTTYAIFFDSGTATLNMEALDVVASIYEVAEETGMTEIRVTGHTDTAENSQELSIERAEAVKRHLVGHGLPPENIAVAGAGADDLLKETGPDVSEQENRRVIVEIGN